jgi:hypothetical protein
LKTHFTHPLWLHIFFALLGSLIIAASLAGCGSGNSMQNCTVTSLTIAPPTATANHLAAPPGNEAFFSGLNNLTTLPPGCVSPGAGAEPRRVDLTWTSSDPVNVSVGNTPVDNGVATCNHATSGPVTITATGPNAINATISGTASLTCN